MNKQIYKERFDKHHDELRWLYMELYDNSSMFAELCDNMMSFFSERKEALKSMDCKRESRKDWYKQNDMLCMGRYLDGDKIIGLFNFSEYDKTISVNETII